MGSVNSDSLFLSLLEEPLETVHSLELLIAGTSFEGGLRNSTDPNTVYRADK